MEIYFDTDIKMVLTVTLNPLLERRIEYSDIIYGSENRNGIIKLMAGGKGINVSRQILKLAVDNHALTFAGGSNGKLFKDIIYKEGIKPVIIRTESETREAFILLEKNNNKITTCFSPNQIITEKESSEFKDKLFKMIPNYEIIVFAGSSPSMVTDSIYPEAIKLCNDFDKVSVCDTYGNHLKACIDSQPTILHNNLSELQISLEIDLKSDKKIMDILYEFYHKGIKQSFITNGSSSFFASNIDFIYKINLPKINEADPTGSGDAFCAGIVYGWHNDLVFEDMLKTAASLGALNATVLETCVVEMPAIDKFHEKISIEAVGKKIKQIDVTPH